MMLSKTWARGIGNVLREQKGLTKEREREREGGEREKKKRERELELKLLIAHRPLATIKTKTQGQNKTKKWGKGEEGPMPCKNSRFGKSQIYASLTIVKDSITYSQENVYFYLEHEKQLSRHFSIDRYFFLLQVPVSRI